MQGVRVTLEVEVAVGWVARLFLVELRQSEQDLVERGLLKGDGVTGVHVELEGCNAQVMFDGHFRRICQQLVSG